MTQPLEQKTSTETFDISIDTQAREIGLAGEGGHRDRAAATYRRHLVVRPASR